MVFSVGLDIGGSKIAGILIDDTGRNIAQIVKPTPSAYPDFLVVCDDIVRTLTVDRRVRPTIGVGVPGIIDHGTGIVSFISNIPYLSGQSLRLDLEDVLKKSVHIANDAGCAALSEAIDGAAAAQSIVFAAILGTGVGGGLAINHKIVEGANNLIGEFGHLPLPFRDKADGPIVECRCGQYGCIDKTISGPALERLYCEMGGAETTALQIAELALQKHSLALKALDQFYTTIAKAMITIIHTYDPEIIIISGGLSKLPHLYETVPIRWNKYCLSKNLKTKILPAKHGPMSGLRGAAWLGIKADSTQCSD